MDVRAKMSQYVLIYSPIERIRWSLFFQLPPDEDVRRKQRRDRNKEAAAKCRRKRSDLRETLEKVCISLCLSWLFS